MSAWKDLLAIGYAQTEDKGLCHPDGSTVKPQAMERLRQMSGRVSNIAYMARVMDQIDGVEHPAPGTWDGDNQFRHLVTHHPIGALCYFALRRLQRAGDLVALRRGLFIMLAFDHDEMTADDALAALWPEGSERPAELPALPAPQRALVAA